MEWHCCEFGGLSAVDLYAILHARNAVLVVEDAHTHLDVDGKDAGALHVFALVRGGDGTAQVAAYARVLPGDDIDPDTLIDKVLTSEAHRDDNTLDRLIEQTLAAALAAWPGAAVRVHAPRHRQAFYQRFGFRKAYGPYLEHGAPFVGMVRATDRAAGALQQMLRRVAGARNLRRDDTCADNLAHRPLSVDSGAH
ncbi:drug:proton antiporter [Burkholderia ubonensis]|uniref:Drug:proton antiporter n=1 Tax=Burkholderia ubonensis TaxID=101571 RepID=A0AB73FT27_9BURK|nr:drug:proton antiporter [Burkholderia ubonensis]KVK83882.1 drug:proton antiporter [Burkholderia ubonensis]KVL82921.1 drug:proton antiporter [Burkholderia ubonensis]KVM23918.1 drug:proton antiporter [Burkholderia ubonensis]KVM35421.1 drug:proton antiporter [Burkholderia ubonensis]